MRSQDGPNSEPIGHVCRIGPGDVLVVETDGEFTHPGTRCVTEDGSPAGVVADVIGPVEAPLLVVDPDRGPKDGSTGRSGEHGSLVGTDLYAR